MGCETADEWWRMSVVTLPKQCPDRFRRYPQLVCQLYENDTDNAHAAKSKRMVDCEAGNNATRVRIVMVGDFPRDAESIGGGVESVMLYLCEQLGSKERLDLEVVTLDRWQLGNREINSSNKMPGE